MARTEGSKTEPKKSTKSKAKAAPKAKAAVEQAPAKRSEAPEAEGRNAAGVLERGDLFFFYRPNAGGPRPGGLADVRRFHLALRPEGGGPARMITIGKKSMPEADGEGGRDQIFWAFVDKVFDGPEGLRDQLEGPGDRGGSSALPAGEGVYALARRGRETVLAYVLELPEEPGEVQQAFHIEKQGRYVVSMKNPDAGSPGGSGLDDDRQADYPDHLRAMFGDRRWLPADPPEFLDHEGAELVLIGGRVAPGDDLGIELEPEPEDEHSAEVFRVLHLHRSERVNKPLFEGTWA